MEIRLLDVSNDAEFSAWNEARRAALLFEREGMHTWSEHEARVTLTVEESSGAWAAFVAVDGVEVVGGGVMYLPLTDNVDMAMFEVNVPPGHRRRGIGTALVDYQIEHARRIGRSTLLVEADLPYHQRDSHPSRLFADKHGFSVANVEIRRTLALPVPDATVQAWVDKAAPHHADYRLATFDDDLPEELLESYCYLLNQLAVDAPTGEIEFEAEAMTPQGLREREHKMKEAGRLLYSTVALDRAGEAVAHTVLCLSNDDPVNVVQYGTLVRREHRGHRLGLAVKAQNLREVQRAHPDRRRIVTTNAETNDHMVAINELMGFEPLELLVEFQRKL